MTAPPVTLRFDPETLCIVFERDGGTIYEVDLERCRTSAEVLDWLGQLSHKTWLSDADLGRLVRLLDELLDLQGGLCGSGTEHGPVNVPELLPRVRAARREASAMVARVTERITGRRL